VLVLRTSAKTVACVAAEKSGRPVIAGSYNASAN
jgi:hypothetical protein